MGFVRRQNRNEPPSLLQSAEVLCWWGSCMEDSEWDARFAVKCSFLITWQGSQTVGNSSQDSQWIIMKKKIQMESFDISAMMTTTSLLLGFKWWQQCVVSNVASCWWEETQQTALKASLNSWLASSVFSIKQLIEVRNWDVAYACQVSPLSPLCVNTSLRQWQVSLTTARIWIWFIWFIKWPSCFQFFFMSFLSDVKEHNHLVKHFMH